ncbi:polynucleotide adenylyltransferase [Spirochaetia bacterium]|nr:polynucleotide adenylyltransferase [Spirochaetia bacterium]
MRIRYSSSPTGKPVKKALVYTKEEHGIRIADVDREAIHIVERLSSAGYETYIVGGAVRDLILGKKPKDFDIVSAANPTRIKKIFRNARIIGHRFRLVHVFFGPKIYEVSTFRSLKDGHTSNTFGVIDEDVLRRDFTLNALFYDPLKEIVVDYVGGMKDIREKRIKAIIPLPVIFTDDPVRMIRAVKYAAVADFKIPLQLKWKIRSQSSLLESISPSRLTEEMAKILHSQAASRIVAALDDMGLYAYLQPEAAALLRKKTSPEKTGKPSFRERYLKGLDELCREGGPSGQALEALIRDFIEDTTDWTVPPADVYKNAYYAARKFVLPINPPRIELDNAVRLMLHAHGISVKKSRIYERRRAETPAQASAHPAAGHTAAEKPVTADVHPAEAKAPAKKRRRRRKKSPASGSPSDL